MSTIDTGLTLLRSAAGRVSAANGWMGNAFKGWMPTGLYARALLIMIVPMVILQSVVAFVFMERHWNTVTRRLSAAVVQDIAALIDVYKGYPQDKDRDQIRRIAQQRLGLVVDFLPAGDMPPPGPKPFFSLLDQTLSVQLGRQIGRSFWIDTVGRSNLVEIRIQLDDAVMRVFAQRSAAYASNSEIFLFWMVGTSSILLIVAVLFLRNQIKPILRLADAAESFGKGREAPNFRPRGAREVRRAAVAFLEMKSRIERTMEQRTAMLAGVSHDLRTILTRFKLELALIGDSPEMEGMRKDVDEMSMMLEDYLAFARGDSGEQSQPTDMAQALEELRSDAERHGHTATVTFQGLPVVTVKPASFKRCLANLVTNAARYGKSIAITGQRDHRYLTVTVEDDGPGIPAHLREEVFKPFLRLDNARNQDEGGTGLGLAIARDIARSHGGDITLGDSPMGGLRASVRIRCNRRCSLLRQQRLQLVDVTHVHLEAAGHHDVAGLLVGLAGAQPFGFERHGSVAPRGAGRAALRVRGGLHGIGRVEIADDVGMRGRGYAGDAALGIADITGRGLLDVLLGADLLGHRRDVVVHLLVDGLVGAMLHGHLRHRRAGPDHLQFPQPGLAHRQVVGARRACRQHDD